MTVTIGWHNIKHDELSYLFITVTMHHMCNRRSYPDPFTEWKGGFLIFNSQLLPAEHENECAIFLRTTSSQGIVINFSEWEMEGNCDSVNLTIVDGELRDRSYPGKSLDGKFISELFRIQNVTNHNPEYLVLHFYHVCMLYTCIMNICML